MNYFCSLFNYAIFSNIFSLCQKPYQKKTIPQEKPRGIAILTMSVFSVHRNDLDRMDQASLQQVAGNRQTSHHDAHHAHQLDEDVQ